MSDFAQRRHAMVESQLRPSSVEDPRLLDAMGEVPREAFLPRALKAVAYQDEDIPMGDGRSLIEPLVLGRLLQSAGTREGEVALVLGCPTGYCAAVLSRLVATVFYLREDQAELDAAEKIFTEHGYDNIVVVGGKAATGHAAQAPYNLILIAGAVTAIPPALTAQLAEGGRLATVLRDGRAAKICIVQKAGAGFGTLTPFDGQAPLVPELVPAPGFRF